MIIFLIIGLALMALAVTLGVRAANTARVRSSQALERIDSYGFTGRTESVIVKSGGVAVAAVDDLVSRLGDFVSTRLHGLNDEQVRKELVAAGLYSLTPRKFAGYRILSSVGVPAFVIWLLTGAGLPVALVFVGAVASVAAGWMVPISLVRNRAKRRLIQIDYQLPELIDLLVVTIEAGVGFTGSLGIAGERISGPLGEELRLARQEQTMGLSTNEALSNMMERADTPGMRSFVRSVMQGERLGVSIGQILRNVADDMRKRRRAIAEERAQKAPVKILFPLVFMIFPAIFVILLGPALYTFMDALHK
jgi:tight adherence protein C